MWAAFLQVNGSLPSWVLWGLSLVWFLGLCWLASEGRKLHSGLRSMKADERFQTIMRNSVSSAAKSKSSIGHTGETRQ